jgi:phospholipid/cholesterol/gamma-HCH transport system permease protein
MRVERIEVFKLFGGAAILSKQVVRDLFRPPLYIRLVLDQVYRIGVESTPLVLITAASTGMVMTLQFGVGLEKFGGKPYVPKIIALSIVREMGPVFTCIMLAARVGAGIASEIGSMTVTQQIDAIRALGTSPIKKIVIPRVLASLIAIPLLVVMSDVIGITGSLIVSVNDLGLDAQFFIQKVLYTVVVEDFIAGWAKTPFFALFISITACYFGLNVQGGTQGVGSSTTKSVVTSCIMIFVGDYFLTKLFWVIGQWL